MINDKMANGIEGGAKVFYKENLSILFFSNVLTVIITTLIGIVDSFSITDFVKAFVVCFSIFGILHILNLIIACFEAVILKQSEKN